jgi:hypothetical protein
LSEVTEKLHAVVYPAVAVTIQAKPGIIRVGGCPGKAFVDGVSIDVEVDAAISVSEVKSITLGVYDDGAGVEALAEFAIPLPAGGAFRNEEVTTTTAYTSTAASDTASPTYATGRICPLRVFPVIKASITGLVACWIAIHLLMYHPLFP